MASDDNGKRFSLSPTVSLTSSTKEQWNARNEELMGNLEHQSSPAAQDSEASKVSTKSMQHIRRRKRVRSDSDESDDSMKRAAKKLRRVPRDAESDGDNSSVSSDDSQERRAANRRMASLAKNSVFGRQFLTPGRARSTRSSSSRASSRSDRGSVHGASTNNNITQQTPPLAQMTPAPDSILQAQALLQLQAEHETQASPPAHASQPDQGSLSPVPSITIESSQDGDPEMTDADDDEAVMINAEIENPDDEGSNFDSAQDDSANDGAESSPHSDDEGGDSTVDKRTPDEIIADLRRKLREKDKIIAKKDELIKSKDQELGERISRISRLEDAYQALQDDMEQGKELERLRTDIAKVTAQRSVLEKRLATDAAIQRSYEIEDISLIAGLRELDSSIGRWKGANTTKVTQKTLARRLKNSKNSAEWAKFAALDENDVPVILSSEGQYGARAAQEFVGSWLWNEVGEVLNQPFSFLDGSFDGEGEGVKTRSQKAAGLGTMMGNLEHKLNDCGINSKTMENWHRDTLRMFSAGHHSGLQLQDAITPENLAPMLDETISKAATSRADAFLEKAGPLLVASRGKSKTAAKESLTDIFKAATLMMLKLHTQVSEPQCGTDNATWLDAGYQPNITQYTLHTLHATAVKKDAHFPDERAMALICCPAVVMRGNVKGEQRDTFSRILQKSTIILNGS